MCQSTKYCLSQILPNIFILQLRRNIPWTTMTLIVFCFGKSALERNAAMFILWTWGKMSLKGIFFSNFGNLYMLQNNLLLNRGLLTGEVLAKLPDPNGFGLGFSSTLQGARLESLMRERSWLTTRQKESKRDCNRPTAVRIMKRRYMYVCMSLSSSASVQPSLARWTVTSGLARNKDLCWGRSTSLPLDRTW